MGLRSHVPSVAPSLSLAFLWTVSCALWTAADAGGGSGCGVRPLRPLGRIVGGVATKPGDYPWQVSIKYKSGFVLTHLCGGALLNSEWIVTAAHCFENRLNLSRYIFRFGDFNKSAVDEGEVDVKGDKLIMHPHFDVRTFRNDIALVRLATPLDLEGAHSNLETICLPDPRMDFKRARCMATGWGETSFRGRHSELLMEVMLPVWDHQDCYKAYVKYNKITDKMFCAGYKAGKKSSCSGDSGGPLQCTFDEEVWYLGGVVSHSVYCALPNMPTVFTKVVSYLPYMASVMKRNARN